jgi:hypothetical protein
MFGAPAPAPAVQMPMQHQAMPGAWMSNGKSGRLCVK